MDGAALIMRAVAEGGASSAAPMREAALGEGAMLHHLAIAVAGKASASPASLAQIDGCRVHLRNGSSEDVCVPHVIFSQRAVPRAFAKFLILTC